MFSNAELHTLKSLADSATTRRLADALAEQLANIPDNTGSLSIAQLAETGRGQNRFQIQLDFINSLLVKIRTSAAEQYLQRDFNDHINLLAAPAQILTSIHRNRTAATAPDNGFMAPWLSTTVKVRQSY